MASVTEELVRGILLDGRAGRRLLNESGVHIDVWARFARELTEPADLLLMPFDKTPAPQLATKQVLVNAPWRPKRPSP